MLSVHIAKSLGNFCLAVDFEIGAEVLVLFGPSGAGKSITLNCLAGLATPETGTIQLGSRPLFDHGAGINLPARARRIGYVFQNYALFPHLTVRDNVAFGLHHHAQASHRVSEMLALTGLTDLATRYPAQLSGGQQQRVALARALAPEPKLLLLDEPFSALDAPTRMQLRDELRRLQRHLQIPIVFVTHDLGEAYFLADRLAVIAVGHILQADTPGEILKHPGCLPVAQAVGAKNILPGFIEAGDDAGCRVRVGSVVLDAPPHPGQAGTRVHVCIRPERIMFVHSAREDDSPHENALQGEIVGEMSDGMNVTLYFRTTEPLVTDPTQDFDLQIELPVYVYERLDLAHHRAWTVSLRRNAVHLIR